MDMAMNELPLALFTTLAPIGAGAFIILAVAFFTAKFSDEQIKAIDKMTLVPLIVVLAGFAASFAHLASPMNAAGVLSGLGTSPLSNEIAVGSLFVLAAIAYCVLALMGKLGEKARKGFIAAVAVLAALFALFTGMAYMMDTIASWYTPLTPVSILGFALFGGALLATLVLSLAKSLDDALKTPFKMAVLVIAVVGAVLAVAAVGFWFSMVAGMVTAVADGALMTSAVAAYLVAFIVCVLIAIALEIYVLMMRPSTALIATSVVVVTVAVFLARLVFYALQISVGL